MAHFRLNLTQDLQNTLHYAVNLYGGVPGVVGIVSDENKNCFEMALGKRAMDKDWDLRLDSIHNLFSITKSFTAVVGMKLVEDGILDLNCPAKVYLEELGEIPLLKGFDEKQHPLLAKPKKDILLRDLFLHTSGFGYEFFNQEDVLYRQVKNVPSVLSNTFDSLKSVLLFEPGTRWNYGISIDWLGKVIESVCKQRLNEAMRKYIFQPCGMKDCAFDLTQDMQERRVIIHNRQEDGKILPSHELTLPNPTPTDMGGHGLSSSALDFMKFVRMFLNDGMGEHGRVLKADTLDFMSQSGIGDLECRGWESAIPSLSNRSVNEFLPGTRKGWGYSFQLNTEDAPSGAPAGTIRWAGISNLFFFIDRKNKIGGFWGSQILPFIDVASYQGYLNFENTVYRNLVR